MLDPRSLARRRDEIAESCKRRGVAADVDALIALYEKAAAKQKELDGANQRRKEHQRAGRGLAAADAAEHAAEGRALKEACARVEAQLQKLRAKFDAGLLQLPNFIHPQTPDGGEDCARELRRFGAPRTEAGLRDHLQIGAALDLLDFEAGARVAGQKWYYLKNDAVLLELALQRYALDAVVAAGFTPYLTPDAAKPELVQATGFNPRGAETQVYSLANAPLCLVGTAEITLGALFADAILREEELPKRVAGISHCFRTEAGAAGRESRGLYRVHQFTKTEMFTVARPEDSEAMHAELLAVEEGIWRGLEIPYRVVDIAAADLGAPAYRKFDLEAWLPGRGQGGAWGEVTSASNCTDYQARRLRTRFRRKGSKKNEFVHMLNGTAISNARAVLALLECHQRADGGVNIPAALQQYFGRETIAPRAKN